MVSQQGVAPMLNAEQRRVLRGMALAMVVILLVLGLGTFLARPLMPVLPRLEDRLAFTLRCDLFIVAWLAAGIAAVARGRFFSTADIQGSGFGAPGPRIAVAAAVLQNTLEQVVLALAAHHALASLLRGREMVLIPLLVALFCGGRLAFWIGYRRGAGSRALGFGLTFYPSVLALGLAFLLLVVRT
jgi:hypothetical protein